MTASSNPKIAILGAGLLGRMLAFSLRDSANIHLFDQDNGDASQSAAYLAAAMLAPLAESAESSAAVMNLGEQAVDLWRKLLEQLPQEVFFQQQGSLILAFEQDFPTLKNFEKNLKGQDYRPVDFEQIQTLEPEVKTRFQQGLFLPNEGQLDNRQLLSVLAEAIQAHPNIAWHTQAKVSLKTSDNQVPEVWVNQQPLKHYGHFDWVIDCRGLGAKDAQTDLRGVRGEVIRLHAPQVTLHRPVRLMHPRYPIYIAPKPNHEFVVGATQLETEDNRESTVRSTLELLSACFSVHSGFAEAQIRFNQAGLRPAYLDNEPQMRVMENFISLNGLYRHGYLLSPILVDLCQEYVLNQSLNSNYLHSMPSLVQFANRPNNNRKTA